jgi:hypothetical protein
VSGVRPLSPGRLYWICQAAGWGSFLAYVLGFYLFWNHPARGSDVVSIVFVNGVLCPGLAHALRDWMYAGDWLRLPPRRLLLRLAAVVMILASGLTAVVALVILVIDGAPFPRAGVIGTFAAFCWAFTGWLVIYYVVHVRRRRDALQLELTVVARDAELQSLRAQLNPHFLFNCLNSLRHLIVVNPERATSMVTGLAELLRYALVSDQKDTVSLAEELTIVDEYLELERVRLEQRLHVERQVEPSALRAKVPPMIVQTLVDNAIKHGIAELAEGGTIRIDARLIGQDLRLVVTNTGAFKPTREGYGLRNATDRLRLLYGTGASLDVRDLNGHTEATLTVPFAPEVVSERVAR